MDRSRKDRGRDIDRTVGTEDYTLKNRPTKCICFLGGRRTLAKVAVECSGGGCHRNLRKTHERTPLKTRRHDIKIHGRDDLLSNTNDPIGWAFDPMDPIQGEVLGVSPIGPSQRRHLRRDGLDFNLPSRTPRSFNMGRISALSSLQRREGVANKEGRSEEQHHPPKFPTSKPEIGLLRDLLSIKEWGGGGGA